MSMVSLQDIEFGRLSVGQGISGTSSSEQGTYHLFLKGRMVVDDKGLYRLMDCKVFFVYRLHETRKLKVFCYLALKRNLLLMDYQLKILDLLCSYFTVSVEKARYMQEAVTKNERCALTGLYNYRYLEEQLTYQMGQVTSNGSIRFVCCHA